MNSITTSLAPAAIEPAPRGINWFPVAVFALVWVELISRLRFEWSINPQYGYGWTVPFLAAYIFWRRWQDALRRPRSRNSGSSRDCSSSWPPCFWSRSVWFRKRTPTGACSAGPWPFPPESSPRAESIWRAGCGGCGISPFPSCFFSSPCRGRPTSSNSSSRVSCASTQSSTSKSSMPSAFRPCNGERHRNWLRFCRHRRSVHWYSIVAGNVHGLALPGRVL